MNYYSDPIYHQMRLFFVSLILLYFSSPSFAAEWVDVSEFYLWSGNYSENVIRIQTPGLTIQNPDSCGDPDSYMVSAALDPELQQRIYSLLLAAYFANQEVRLRITGCQSNRPAIQVVILRD